MTLALASVLLALLNLTSAALIAERCRAGWLVALAAQLPWSWYDLRTGQLGFLLLTLVYVPVYVRGWRTGTTTEHRIGWPRLLAVTMRATPQDSASRRAGRSDETPVQVLEEGVRGVPGHPGSEPSALLQDTPRDPDAALSQASSLPGRLARLGWTRIGSPGIFGV